ncbi:Phosphomethylpyrimidine synthase 2 [Bienertia sinuspersici]
MGEMKAGEESFQIPTTEKIANAVIEWKHKEVTGEFTPIANRDALYMVLGNDHYGRVKGQGGVRLGMKKVFGEDYSATRSSANNRQDMEAIKSALREELREEMKENFIALLQHMGLPGMQLLHQGTIGDRLRQQGVSISNEIPGQPDLEEEIVMSHSRPLFNTHMLEKQKGKQCK